MFLLVASALIGLATGTVVIAETFGGLANALSAQLLDLLLLLGLLRGGLGILGKEARFLQTGTAMFGTGALINLVTMPIQLLVDSNPSGSFMHDLGALLYIVLIIWAVVILGHILRNAFEIRLWGGILIALNYFLLINWLIQTLLFPT